MGTKRRLEKAATARRSIPRRRPEVECLEDRTVLSLVAAFGFNEGAGTTAADSSGNANNGALTGGPAWTAGRYGAGLTFDGVNDLVTVADANSLDLTTGMTLEAWVNPTTLNGWETVLLKEASGELSYALYAADDASPRRPAAYIRQGSTSYSATGSAAIPLNTWTHLAATYDAANLRLYVNGTQVSSIARTGAINTTANPLRIGGNNVWAEWFNGAIDEVRVYNHALTAAEIQADMNTPIADTTPPTVVTVAPAAGATNAALAANVTATFSEAIDPATVTTATLELRGPGNAVVPAAVTYSAATLTATLDPSANLLPGTAYTAVVRGGAADPRVKDLAGNALAADYTWSFQTAPISLAISDAVVSEGAATATFTVTLNAASSQTVTVTYATADGTATAGSDYTAVGSAVLTFDPGQTSATITVPIVGDTAGEPTETFTVNLSSPTNAILGDAQGVGTITDDDATPIGTEGFGYTAFTHPYEAIDLVAGAAGVITIRSTGNNNTSQVTFPAGTTFNYYGTSYTTLFVSTNGLITFGTANTSATNTNLTSAPTQAALAPLWDDWTNVTNQPILLGKYEDTNGDTVPDRLIVEWNNVQGNPTSPSTVTFQAILQLNTGTTPGAVTYNYVDLDAGNAFSNGGGATVGFKDAGTQGSRRLVVSQDNAASPFVGSGKAVRIAPDAAPPAITVTSPAAGASVSGSVTLTATASDNVGVAGVQFYVDGVAVGAFDTTAPYAVAWDTTAVPNGSHVVTAQARDPVGNTATAGAVPVTVTNNVADPAQVGQWSSVINWPLVAINSVLLKDGRVLMWDGDPNSNPCIGSTSARVWDPATGAFTPVPIPYFTNQDDDIFCSAQALMADGRVLVVGGHDCDGPGLGIKMTNIFDPATLTWTRGPDMAYARWYPTATTLSDGRVLVTGGSTNTTIDYVPYAEVYNPVTNTWTTVGNNQPIPSYSFVFDLPDGRVLVAGSDEAKMPTYALNLATQAWTTIDPTVLDAGSGVMYLPGKVMKAGSSYLSPPADNGGNVPSAATTYVLDATQPSPAWQSVAPMANARTHLNLTVLPDGNVLATGGSQDIGGLTPSRAVFPAELWSPLTQSWTTMASMQTPRMYHSTALLLPDGRVAVAGGGRLNTTNYLNAEIYSPPYLFKGTRPTVSSAPGTVAYGSSFFVGTPDGASITSVALIRNGSVTHSFNMDQRLVPLAFTQSAGGLTVQAPANANLAPPGHYMLFLVNSNGVPSIAPFVRLPAGYEDAQPPTAPANLAATGAIGSASLTWSPATDNIGVARYNVHRATTAGFVPTAANRVGQPTTTSYTDTGMPAGTYYYVVTAEDAAGNTSAPSPEASAVVTADTTAPTVAVTSPAPGATVSGAVTVTASASDNVAVAGVQFLLDGVALGAEDTQAPYSVAWNTATASNGNHALTARARDAAGNLTTSSVVTVTVSNQGPTNLVAAYGFEEGAGATTADASGNGHTGTITGAGWNTAGRFGNSLTFNGTNAWVTVADSNLLDLTTGMTLEAWVYPSAINADWRTVLLKERPGGLAYCLYAADGGNRPPAGYIFNGADRAVVGSTSLALNTWTHLAATYDGSNLRLYVGGTLAQTTAVTGSIVTSTGVLRMGGNSVWGEYFAGRIDEVRIYSRALSAAEIQADMNTAVGGGPTGARSAGKASEDDPKKGTPGRPTDDDPPGAAIALALDGAGVKRLAAEPRRSSAPEGLVGAASRDVTSGATAEEQPRPGARRGRSKPMAFRPDPFEGSDEW